MAKPTRSLSLNDKNTVALLDETCLWSAPFGRMLLDEVAYRDKMRFLDIGPGTGFPLIELAQRLYKSEAYGIDPWDAARRRIKAKADLLGLTNVSIVKGKAERLPFDDDFFDLIVSNNGLNNVSDIGRVLEECRRTMKKGARLVFTVNLPGSMKEFYAVFRTVLRRNKMEPLVADVDRHIRSKRLPEKAWMGLLKAHNFRNITSSTDSFSFKFSNAEAIFGHFFMKIAFIPSWEEIVPAKDRKKIFRDIKSDLNALSGKKGCIELTIPMICFNCGK
ncbi:MAG: class I SAM-dependent methyltransferase [Spirochaetes bacterium]|nr:class I SAM-dependent methyltransferase [Spirochaetota bacterium]